MSAPGTSGCLTSRERLVRQDAFQGSLTRPPHDRVALDVVPDQPHRLNESPRLASLPFKVVAAQVITEHLPRPGLEQMPRTHKVQRRVGRPKPPTSRTPASRPADTSTLPGIRSQWAMASSAAPRGRSRRVAQIRRSRGTSRSCSLCRKQVSIHASWDRRSPSARAGERAATRVDGSQFADEIGQVTGKR